MVSCVAEVNNESELLNKGPRDNPPRMGNLEPKLSPSKMANTQNMEGAEKEDTESELANKGPKDIPPRIGKLGAKMWSFKDGI